MPRKLASKGSPTSTGGVVLEGNEHLYIDGQIISSVGQLASCPVCPIGQGPIVAVGERTLYLPAGPAAREGDYVACGCPPFSNTLLGQQHSALAGAEHVPSVTQVLPVADGMRKNLHILIERRDDEAKPGLLYKVKDKTQHTLFKETTCPTTGEGTEQPVADYAACDTVWIGDDTEWTFFSYEEPLKK